MLPLSTSQKRKPGQAREVWPEETEEKESEDAMRNIAECSESERAKNPQFIIWNPRHDAPPTARFDTQAQAEEVARDMAQRFGDPFYVCELVSLSESVAHTNPVKRAKK